MLYGKLFANPDDKALYMTSVQAIDANRRSLLTRAMTSDDAQISACTNYISLAIYALNSGGSSRLGILTSLIFGKKVLVVDGKIYWAA